MVWALALLANGCVLDTAYTDYYDDPQDDGYTYSPQYSSPPPTVSVYVEPLLYQPEPVAVSWAPPPLLVEAPPPQPYVDAVWIGGYWVWEGDWVWAHGRWCEPPRRGYVWHAPYYENRHDSVIFIDGYWSSPRKRFEPPPPDMRIPIAAPRPGVRPGPRPVGPIGVFIPPPPGSRHGIIVPAPIGTPPAAITGAPPVSQQGMRIQADDRDPQRYRVVAPPSATSGRHSVNISVPTQADQAARAQPFVRNVAPDVRTSTPIPTYQSGRPPVGLPPAQPVRTEPGPGYRGSRQDAPVSPNPPAGQPQPTYRGQDSTHRDALTMPPRATGYPPNEPSQRNDGTPTPQPRSIPNPPNTQVQQPNAPQQPTYRNQEPARRDALIIPPRATGYPPSEPVREQPSTQRQPPQTQPPVVEQRPVMREEAPRRNDAFIAPSRATGSPPNSDANRDQAPSRRADPSPAPVRVQIPPPAPAPTPAPAAQPAQKQQAPATDNKKPDDDRTRRMSR